MDDSYSLDVELDHTGKLVFARDIGAGEKITVPGNLFGKIGDLPRKHTIITPIDRGTWMKLALLYFAYPSAKGGAK